MNDLVILLGRLQKHIEMLERLLDSSHNVCKKTIKVQLQAYRNVIKMIQE